MRVCVDYQPAIAQGAGIGRYTSRLVDHLAACADGDTLSLCFFDFRRQSPPVEIPGVHARAIRWCPGSVMQRAWKYARWPPYEPLAGPADVYHFPNFLLPPLRKGKAVVTIHDMSFMRFPEYGETRNVRNLTRQIRETADRADAIITDSVFSGDEIEELLGVDRRRLFPIHLGVEPSFRPQPAADRDAALSRLGVTRPYLLTVGTVEPRKNIPHLVDVFEALTSYDGSLVIGGSRGWKAEPILQRLKTSTHASRIHLLDRVPDDTLPGLYAGADAFLTASFYEGFGLPPLEAMACGTPVVSSSGGALKEVLAEGAQVLDDYDVTHWVDTVEGLLGDTSHRREQVQAARNRAATFGWGSTAKKTWDVYRSLV